MNKLTIDNWVTHVCSGGVSDNSLENVKSN